MHRRTRQRTLWALCALVVGGGLSAASAAGLGLSSDTLTSFSDHAVVAAPPIIACDGFALPSTNNTLMAGRPVQRPAQCGSQAWVLNTGAWKLKNGQARASGNHATITLAVGRTDVSAEATLNRADRAGRAGGLAIAHSGGTSPTYLAAVLAGPGSVQLRLSDGSTVATIASGVAAIGPTARLRVTLSAGVVTISLAGVVVLSYTLTAAQSAIIAGNTRAGLYDHQGSLRFDDIVVTNAWAP